MLSVLYAPLQSMIGGGVNEAFSAQAVAVVLTQLDSKTAGNVLSFFSADFQVDVVRRMANTKHTDCVSWLNPSQIHGMHRDPKRFQHGSLFVTDRFWKWIEAALRPGHILA